MVNCFIKNGGLYIKLGQIISQLTFIVPPVYQKVMERCCMDCPQSSMKSIETVIKEDLGHSLGEIFSEFDPKPIASASLAQVHKAKLKSNGDIVAVKVQHQWIKENCPGDAKVIDFCVNVAEKVFPMFKYKVKLFIIS